MDAASFVVDKIYTTLRGDRSARDGRAQPPYGQETFKTSPVVLSPQPNEPTEQQILADSYPQPYSHPLDLDNFSNETSEIRRMYRFYQAVEPAAKSAIEGLTNAVADMDVTVQPDDDENDDDKRAAEMVEWTCERNADGWDGLVRKIIHPAFVDGFSIGELLFASITDGRKFAGLWGFDSLHNRDTEKLRLRLDTFRNVLGIVNTVRGVATYSPRKVLVFTHAEMYDNPHGSSELRAATRACQLIDNAYKLWYYALTAYSGPFLVGKTSDDARRQQFQTILKAARGGGFIVVPKEDEVDLLNLASASNFDAFRSKIDKLREEIFLSVRGGYLPFMQGSNTGGGETRGSAGQSQGSGVDPKERMIAKAVGRALTRTISASITRANFGPKVGVPRIILGGVNWAETKAQLDVYKSALTDFKLEGSKKMVRSITGWVAPKDDADKIEPPADPFAQPGMGGPPPGPGGDGQPADPNAPPDDGTDPMQQLMAGAPNDGGGEGNPPKSGAGSSNEPGDRSTFSAFFRTTFSAPGPPPRPGLVWKEKTHRWINPHTGEETDPHTGQVHPPTPAAAAAAALVSKAPPGGTVHRVNDALAAFANTGKLPDDHAVPTLVKDIGDLSMAELRALKVTHGWTGNTSHRGHIGNSILTILGQPATMAVINKAPTPAAPPTPATPTPSPAPQPAPATPVSAPTVPPVAPPTPAAPARVSMPASLAYSNRDSTHAIGSKVKELISDGDQARTDQYLDDFAADVSNHHGVVQDAYRAATGVAAPAGIDRHTFKQAINDYATNGPPGGPPRPGLVWKASTHRWIDPTNGQEYSTAGNPIATAVASPPPAPASTHPAAVPAVTSTRPNAPLLDRQYMTPAQSAAQDTLDNSSQAARIAELRQTMANLKMGHQVSHADIVAAGKIAAGLSMAELRAVKSLHGWTGNTSHRGHIANSILGQLGLPQTVPVASKAAATPAAPAVPPVVPPPAPTPAPAPTVPPPAPASNLPTYSPSTSIMGLGKELEDHITNGHPQSLNHFMDDLLNDPSNGSVILYRIARAVTGVAPQGNATTPQEFKDSILDYAKRINAPVFGTPTPAAPPATPAPAANLPAYSTTHLISTSASNIKEHIKDGNSATLGKYLDDVLHDQTNDGHALSYMHDLVTGSPTATTVSPQAWKDSILAYAKMTNPVAHSAPATPTPAPVVPPPPPPLPVPGYSRFNSSAVTISHLERLKGDPAGLANYLNAIETAYANSRPAWRDQQSKNLGDIGNHFGLGLGVNSGKYSLFAARRIVGNLKKTLGAQAPQPGSSAPAVAPPSTAPAVPPKPMPSAASDVTPTGKSLGGSTGAVQMKDSAGNLYVQKSASKTNAGHVENEMHANDIYRAAGLAAPTSKTYGSGANKVVLNSWVGNATHIGDYMAKATPTEAAQAIDKLREGFAVDALLGNWDVFGNDDKNTLIDGQGVPHRIDNGGALGYRAQGTKKTAADWGNTVGELDSLRGQGPSGHHATAMTKAVYGGMSDAEVAVRVDDLKDKMPSIISAAPKAEQAKLAARYADMQSYADRQLSVPAGQQPGTVPPHPGLVFDKTKHRWVRPIDLTSAVAATTPGTAPAANPADIDPAALAAAGHLPQYIAEVTRVAGNVDKLNDATKPEAMAPRDLRQFSSIVHQMTLPHLQTLAAKMGEPTDNVTQYDLTRNVIHAVNLRQVMIGGSNAPRASLRPPSSLGTPAPLPPSPTFHPWTPPPGPPVAVTGINRGNDPRYEMLDLVKATINDYLPGGDAMSIVKSGGYGAFEQYLLGKGLIDNTVTGSHMKRAVKNLATEQATSPIRPLFINPNNPSTRGPSPLLTDEARPILTHDERTAAQKYTGSLFKGLNESLREGDLPTDPNELKTHIDLQSAFAKTQPMATPVQVVRGLTLTGKPLAAFLDTFTPGAQTQLDGYQSTTVGQQVDSYFEGNVALKIKAIQGLDMRPHQHYPHASELLLNTGGQYKVISKKLVGKNWEIELEQLPVGTPPQALNTTIPALMSQSVNPALAAAANAKKTKGGEYKGKTIHDRMMSSPAITAFLAASPRDQRKHDLHYGHAGGREDTFLSVLMAEHGRDAHPQIVSKKEIESLHGNGHAMAFRANKDAYDNNGKKIKAADIHDQFRSGTMYNGAGIYGNGTYMAIVTGGGMGSGRTKSGAESHVRGTYGTHIAAFAVPSDSSFKVVTHLTIKKQQKKALNDLDKMISAGTLDHAKGDLMKAIIRDEGRFAVLNNYDGITGNGGDYLVLLNRSKVKMSAETWT